MATRDCVDVVITEITGWEGRAVTSVGLSVVVNDVVIHVLIFMDVSVISRVTIGNLIRVMADLDKTPGILNFVVDVVVELNERFIHFFALLS